MKELTIVGGSNGSGKTTFAQKYLSINKNLKMEINELNYPDLYRTVAELTRIMVLASQDAREENFRLGLPNVIGKDGKVFHEFADGRIVQVFPDPNSK